MSNQKKDKLNLILGLGYTSMDRLYDAGIYTFQQLVDAPISQVAAIVKRDVYAVGEWLDSAEKFASGEWEV